MGAMSHVPSHNGLNSLVGLWKIKQQIMRSVNSAKLRNAQLGHCLLTGLGGCGKTSIGRCIAQMMNSRFYETEAADIRNRQNIISWILDCSSKSETFVLFVDEIHRLSHEAQEAFYYPMTDRVVNKDGVKISINPFTLIGATTRRDMLDQGSFVTRFQNIWDVGRYSLPDMETIVYNECVKHGLRCSPVVCHFIASRCIGIPRAAVSLVAKIRDQVLFDHPNSLIITEKDVHTICNLEEIDSIGLNKGHVLYLRALAQSPQHPKGLSVLSALLGQARSVVESSIEPVLLSLGFITATPRGRMLTERGHKHLNFSEKKLDKITD